MKIEKTHHTDKQGARAESLFFFFTPSDMVLPLLFLVIILTAEAYYRFKLYPEKGLENCLGPAGFGAIVLAAALVLKTRSDRHSQAAIRKRQGVSTQQSVTIHDHGIDISQGSLMNTSYAWPAIYNFKVRRKHLVFSLSGGDLLIRRSAFAQEEMDQIIAFWKRKVWSNKGVQSDEERPTPPPLPRIKHGNDFFIDVRCLAAALALSASSYAVDFLNGYSYVYLTIFQPLIQLLASVCFVPCALVVAVRCAMFHKSGAKFTALRTLFVLLILLFGWFAMRQSHIDWRLRGFLARVSRVVSAQEIRDAAIRILDEDVKRDDSPEFVSKSGATGTVPAFTEAIWVSPPRFAGVTEEHGGAHRHFRLTWGGRFLGYWGIAAGRPDFVLPNRSYRRLRRWCEGVYVWWEHEDAPYFADHPRMMNRQVERDSRKAAVNGGPTGAVHP